MKDDRKFRQEMEMQQRGGIRGPERENEKRGRKQFHNTAKKIHPKNFEGAADQATTSMRGGIRL